MDSSSAMISKISMPNLPNADVMSRSLDRKTEQARGWLSTLSQKTWSLGLPDWGRVSLVHPETWFYNRAGEAMVVAWVGGAVGAVLLYQGLHVIRTKYNSLADSPHLLRDSPLHAHAVPRSIHDQRRFATYPDAVPNTWYCATMSAPT